LINEAIKFLAKSKIEYPTEVKDNYTSLYQLVIIFGCVGIVLHFEESGNMEHAYGLAIILCMIMTTILLNFYLIMKRVKLYIIIPVITPLNRTQFSVGQYYEIC
jgi:KUP system potassium uptake protein